MSDEPYVPYWRRQGWSDPAVVFAESKVRYETYLPPHVDSVKTWLLEEWQLADSGDRPAASDVEDVLGAAIAHIEQLEAQLAAALTPEETPCR